MNLSFDALQLRRDCSTDTRLFTLDDVEGTQVVILDDYPDGPYSDLWRLQWFQKFIEQQWVIE